MKTHNLVQGSPEWSAHRRQFFNASDAPAMMGCSAYKTRDQLLHEMHTGLAKEVDAATQRRFDDGHRFEALARPLAVKIIGEQLFPVVGSEGKLSASFDGLTMGEDTAFEHKTLNDELRACMKDHGNGYSLPLQYQVQMEQQLMVSGAERVLFMASKWNGDELVEERHCWYASDPALRARILAGWEQFDADLCAYVPPAAAPLVVAEPVQALPAVSVRVDGTISVIDNFDVFEEAVRNFIEHRLIRAPQTDQDFADLDTQIKAMKGAREAIKAGKAQMLAQIEPVDTANKRADMLDKLLQTNQSMAEKLLASEKENRRTEIVTKPATELREYMVKLNRELGAPYIPMPVVDFAGAIKGMRSLSSMEDAVATRLANAKIDANAVAANVRANLKALNDQGGEFDFLFADKAQLVLKAADDFNVVIGQRITAHKAEVARKEEATRERIRAEEQAKAEKEAREKVLAEQEAERKAAETATKAAARDQVVTGTGAVQTSVVLDDAGGAPMVQVEHIAPANVVPMRAAAPTPAAAPMTPPTMKLGDINALLAPIALSVDGLAKLGFPPAATQQNAKLYHHRDLPRICTALHELLDKVQDQQAA